MDRKQILVTGFPNGTKEAQLMIYFQSERDSGGGDVDSIEIDRGRAYITFEEAGAARRVVRRNGHFLQNCQLQVKFHPDSEDEYDEYEQERHNQRFEECQARHRRRRDLQDLPVSQQFDREQQGHPNEPPVPKQCTVKVKGVLPNLSKDLLTLYFENPRRSEGGPVSSIDMKPDLQICLVTFKNPEDAQRIVDNSPHIVSSVRLDVSLVKEREDELPNDYEDNTTISDGPIKIIVSGISSPITNDTVRYYFENSRRSGGGAISEIFFSEDGEAWITFQEVEDLQKLLHQSHSINGMVISVKKEPPKKKVPLDPIRVQVRGLNEKITGDCLLLYLEKYSGVEVKQVIKGCNNNAVAIFEAEPDFESLFSKVHGDNKGPEGSKPRLERVPVCSSILVEGISENTSMDTIQLYFESNRRSGGDIVSHVERITKSSAIVHFEKASAVQSVIGKEVHKLEDKNLEVRSYLPFLESSTTKKIEEPFDAEVFEHIKINHHHDLLILSEENKVNISMDPDKQVAVIVNSEKGNVPKQLWQERSGRLLSFLQGFKKAEVRIPAELADEVSERWRNAQSSTETSANLISFGVQNRVARIIGRVQEVSDEERRMEDFIRAVEQDTELMKSVAKVTEDGIPKARLRLMELSGVCQNLQNEHQYLKISFDMDGEMLLFEGPRVLLKDVQAKVFALISKMIEKPIELAPNIINVLKKPSVSSHLKDLFKQKNIQAIFDGGQSNSSNEIKIIGVDVNNTREAERTLLAAIQENSIRLTDENAQVLSSSSWKSLHSQIISNSKVEIVVDIPSGTVWVSGVVEDVKECYDQIIDFLQKNTILCDTVVLDTGSTRFVFERLSSKIDEIKKDLATCSVDVRMAADSKGIEVSGTTEGLKRCSPRILELTKSIATASIPIDRPGMKKFFLRGKGPKSLKSIEDANSCIIIPKEGNEIEASLISDEEEEKIFEGTSAEFICSFLTKETKKISVFKGDITKHPVDAIVNAANENLQHAGGLAAEIVREGGSDIQRQCDQFVADIGRLLEGRTLVTTAGRLPCSQIIHTVGPKWDFTAERLRRDGIETRQERVLKLAIKNSLKEAASLKTIAIPAISSGVFGVPRDLCAKVILDAVVEFCQDNPSCHLSEIHLVNKDKPTVIAFSDEMRKRFSKENNFTAEERSGRAIPTLRPRGASNSFTTQEGIQITLKGGDLAKERADILVGTAAGNLKLDQNPCAMALSKKAGQCLQDECDKKKAVSEGNIAVLQHTGGLKCQAVIFAICSDWDNGKGRQILIDLIKKCLKEGDRKNAKSIAFAAIGTGILRFPRDQVAKIYFDEVVSFSKRNPNTKLKDIRFVLYDKDTPTVQAFDVELENRLKNAGRKSKASQVSVTNTSATASLSFSPVTERNPDHLETTIGLLSFQVQHGDITKDSTDAIAVINNPSLDLSVGHGAGAAILNRGGLSISDACAEYDPQRPGSVVATTAGRLKAKFLFHIVPIEPITAKSIKASVLECLRKAEERKVTSISFPAIGTGALDISAKSCAHSILSAVREFANQGPEHMQLVKMTIFQKSMIKDIRSALFEASGQSPPAEPGLLHKFTSGLKTVAGFIGLGGNEASTATSDVQNVDNTKLNLVIYAGSESDLRQASKEVNDLMAENSGQNVISDEVIGRLTEEHLSKIHTLELRYSVKAVVEKEFDRIELCGQIEDILIVTSEIHELLDQIKKDENERFRAEILSKNVQWKFKLGNRFLNYESDLNTKIEIAYQENKGTVTVVQEGELYEISFLAMKETSQNGQSTEIKRCNRGGDPHVPDYWDPQPQDKKVHIVDIKPASHVQEYKKVSDLFKATCQKKIVKIERIQNTAAFGIYAIQQQKMDESVNGSNEMLLFHGTTEDNCRAINHKGFNRSYSWQRNNLYGKGVYFAKEASYSASSQYSPPGPTGFRHMYLARVLVGDYTVGKKDIIVPPSKTLNDPTDTYDSVVDQIPNPEIFVVFQDPQSYPEYLITFQ
ncbi:poly [ADP-ribose] polymerase 14-like [Stylophora pistillata]|uniref:poly [ADP-ribose] polymerase 14-like n=1 Tax=Stylophora pistillata TaxID=50429 RepID=UPI000C039B63|nr:poly [ADP-ribose] polymerase 14-like [Stylophora pistillata]